MSDILKGLVKGLSGFLPQDDPDVKIFNAQNALKDITKKEEEVFTRFGRRIFESQGASEHPDIAAELERLIAEKAAADDNLRQAQDEKAARQRVQEGIEEKRFCSNCGIAIAAGTQFCTACGTRVNS